MCKNETKKGYCLEWQLLSPLKKAELFTHFHDKPPKRDKYYRFRISENEKDILEKNRELLKRYDLTLSDAVRYFALNCINSNALYHLGLTTGITSKKDSKKLLKHKCRAK